MPFDIVWDEGDLAKLDSKTQGQHYSETANQPGAVAKKEGDVAAAVNKATKSLEAVYELPYLAHAPMEPLNCVADVKADSCEIWVGTQFQTADMMAASRITGLNPSKIKLHTTLLGGGFGRRAVLDSHFVVEADSDFKSNDGACEGSMDPVMMTLKADIIVHEPTIRSAQVLAG